MRLRISALAWTLSIVCGLILGVSASGMAKTELKALYFFDKGKEFNVWAIKKGIVTSDLIDLKFKTGSISAIIQALGTRNYDIIETSALAVPFGVKRGLDVRIISSGGRVQGGQTILVKKDSALSHPRDLKGKSIAISALGSTSVNLMRLVLWKKYGMNIARQGGDIVWKELPLSNIPTAVVRGHVDAGYTLQSFTAKSLASGEFKVLLNASDDYEAIFKKRYLPSVWVGYKSLIDKNPAAMKEFQRMLHESVAYSYRHVDEVTADIAKQYNKNQEWLKRYVKWNVMSGKLTADEIASYEAFYKLCKEAGILKDYPPMSTMVWRGRWAE